MLAAASLAPFFVQLSLDLSTPLEVVEMLRSTVDAHVRANPNEFTGSSAGAAAAPCHQLPALHSVCMPCLTLPQWL